MSRTERQDIISRLPRIGRDGILFFAGLAGAFHETVLAETERPSLLVLFATMMGLPAFLRSDERNKKDKDSDGKNS